VPFGGVFYCPEPEIIEIQREKRKDASGMIYHNRTNLFLGILFFLGFLWFTSGISFSNEVTILPSLKAGGEYDSNIDFSRNDEIDDYSGIVIPGLAFTYNTERLMVRSENFVEVYRYFDETDFDKENQYYQLGGDYKLTERWSVSASGLYYKDSTLDTFLDETGIVTDRRDRIRYDIEGGTSYQVTELDQIGVDYLYRNVDFRDKDRVDYETNSVNLIYNRRLNDRRDTLRFQPGFVYRDSDENETDSYSFSVGWLRQYSETLNSRILLGVRYTDISYKDGRADSDFWGGIADLNLTKKWETTSGTIGYSHDLRGNADGDLIEVNRFYCNIQKKIYGRLGAGFNGRLIFSSEEGRNTTSGDTRYFLINPSLFYNLTENHLLRLGYSYANEDDDAFEDDSISERHRVFLGFEFNFPFKI
jgi:hypothetical protein